MDAKIGFVGVGTMAAAMVRGLCTCEEGKTPRRVFVSPRNKEKAEALKSEFPDLVEICSDNQSVLDNSDWVVIGLLPAVAPKVIPELKFKPEHTVVSLVVTARVDQVKSWVLPAGDVVRAIPVPAVQRHLGGTVMTPAHKGVEDLFNALGKATVVEDARQMTALQVAPCLMGPLYQFMATAAHWMNREHGVPMDLVSEYIAYTFHGITADAVAISSKGEGFDALVHEQTPGGVNEGNVKALTEKGVYKALEEVMDATYHKISGSKKQE